MIVLHTLINEDKHQEILDEYLNTVPADFKSKILTYRRWQDAQLSLLGRILLLHGLKTYYHISDPQIEISSNKKPYIQGNPVYFNISHSKDRVVCAIAEFPIGIDIEFSDKAINYLDFQFQMTQGEFEKITRSEDKTESFFIYWTQKEAVIKAHGDGMMMPLDSFEIIDHECIIDDEKFFTKDIFIDQDYRSYIASSDENIKNTEPFLIPVII